MISMIVAADRNNAIGYKNKLLCRLKDDMRHFVQTTKGKPVIMGYKTFASLGFKPLKDRFNIVLTNSPLAMTAEHFDLLEQHENLVFENLDLILFMIEQSPDTEFMVIGGQQTYELFFPLATRVYFTHIHHEFEKADSYFPSISLNEWFIQSGAYFTKMPQNDHPFHVVTYGRKDLLC